MRLLLPVLTILTVLTVLWLPSAEAKNGFYRDGRAMRPTQARYDRQKASLLSKLRRLPAGALRGGGIKLLETTGRSGACLLDTIRLPLPTKLAFLRVMERAAKAPDKWEARPLGLGNPAWGLALRRRHGDRRSLEVLMVSNSTFTGSGALQIVQNRGSWSSSTRVDHIRNPDGLFAIRTSSGSYDAMGDLKPGTDRSRQRILDGDGKPVQRVSRVPAAR
jgi:hypothetical protein